MRPCLDLERENPFRSVVARLKPLVHHCQVPHSECEDCVQEAILALLMAHPDWSIEEPRTLRWLRAVTINQARLYHRRLKMRRTHVVDDLDFVGRSDQVPQLESEAGPDGPIRDRFSTLREALDGLRQVNREIFVQRVERGLTYREIAQGLNLSPEQVRLRFYRTLTKLRDHCRPGRGRVGSGRGEHRGDS